jgi:lysine 2,3-aminomutase
VAFKARYLTELNLPKKEWSKNWNDWKWQLRNRITKKEKLERYIELSSEESQAFDNKGFSFAITPYYLSLMDLEDPNNRLRKSIVPTSQESNISFGETNDPLGEEAHRPVSTIVHRYPDRVLFLATGFCSVYCRYCTRSRLVGEGSELRVNLKEWEKGIEYIKNHREVRDVLITGGDPLTLSDDKLEWLLKRIREIPHVEFIRIGTKIPFVLPQRITPALCRVLKKYHPLWMSLHVIHPSEITKESKLACERLANAGIPLGSHTVLLTGINDDVETMKSLMHELLKIRVKPYYLFHCDPIQGSAHFRTSVEKGVEIINGLRGHTTGYAVPHYVIDIPGRGGKVSLSPNYIVEREGDYLVVKNFRGEKFTYPDQVFNAKR